MGFKLGCFSPLDVYLAHIASSYEMIYCQVL